MLQTFDVNGKTNTYIDGSEDDAMLQNRKFFDRGRTIFCLLNHSRAHWASVDQPCVLKKILLHV